MLVASINNFAHRWRELYPPLDACPRVANVGDYLVRVALQHSSYVDLEPIRIGVLVNSISGKQGRLAAQNQRLPTVRVRQVHDGWMRRDCRRIDSEMFHVSP